MTHGMLDNWDVGKMTCNHRTDDDLLSTNESTFKQGDSCINQFLAATYKMCNSFDYGFYS